MLNRIGNIVVLVFIVISFVGCDYLDGYKDEGMGIQAAVISSVSNDRPAEVVIGAYGDHHNTCVNSEAKVSANRDGNKIYLTAKKEIPLGPGLCGDAISTVYGEVTVKNLEVGEYIIMRSILGKDYELGRLRVESDAAYMEIRPAEMYAKRDEPLTQLDVILSPIVPEDGEVADPSYHVKIVVDIVEFYHDMTTFLDEYKVPGCEAIYKTDLKRTGDVINLDIWRLVRPADSGCLVDRWINPSILQYHSVKAEIDIGTFSAGSYTVDIKGEKFYFDVPQPID